MVFLTDSYHVKDAAGNMIVDQVPGAIAGPNVVQHAIDFVGKRRDCYLALCIYLAGVLLLRCDNQPGLPLGRKAQHLPRKRCQDWRFGYFLHRLCHHR